VVEGPASSDHLDPAATEGAETGGLGNAAPEILERFARAFGTAGRMAAGQHRGVHRACRRAGNAVDAKPWLLEQPVEHAPCECAVGATALQCKVNRKCLQAVPPWASPSCTARPCARHDGAGPSYASDRPNSSRSRSAVLHQRAFACAML